MMEIRLAGADDVAIIAALERTYLHDELAGTANSMKGQAFNEKEIAELVSHHYVVVAEEQGQIWGYVFAGSWSFFANWPIYRGLLRRLSEYELAERRLTERNTCQYGPIWVHTARRGQGIFEALVAHVRMLTRQKFVSMVTFIAEDNQRSYAAHTGKGAMQVVDYYTFDDRDYYVLLG